MIQPAVLLLKIDLVSHPTASESFGQMWHYVGGPPNRRSLCLFGRETKQRTSIRDLRRDRKWGRKQGPREAIEELAKVHREGELAKRDGERQSRTDRRRDQSR